MTDEHEHDELQARLRAADPASSLPPADRDAVARLLEETMSDPHTTESRTDGTHRRSRLTWLIAAAAVVLIAGGIAFGLAIRGGDDAAPGDDTTVAEGGQSPPATEQPSDPATEPPTDGDPTITELAADGAATTGRCMTPNADVIAQQDLAVDATVTSISGGVVTLKPREFYTGEETDLVTVEAPDRQLQALLLSVDFREGERYLVAATDGQVTVCGISADYSARLADLYAQAFPS